MLELGASTTKMCDDVEAGQQSCSRIKWELERAARAG